VLLGDGTVLFLGEALIQRYQPGTSVWSPVSNMSLPRTSPSATVLPDGRVLVAGGYISSSNIQTVGSAEVYDPSAGSWSKAGTMQHPRRYHTATLLQDGRVLLAQGIVKGVDDPPGNDAEVYDPERGSWTPVAVAAHRRFDACAVRLRDGRVLVAGGIDGWMAWITVPEAEVYDPATNAWSSAGALAEPRFEHACVLLGDGRVLVAGGKGGTGSSTLSIHDAELYDPATNTWSSAGAPSIEHDIATMNVLGDGRVLLAGGASAPITATEVLSSPVTEYARDLGAACATSDQCLSGLCTGGACCTSAGECAAPCQSIHDCVASQVCDTSGHCTLPSPNEDSSGCGVAPANRGEAAGWLLALGALAATRVRRRRS
jgi:MYXO-CTERM domain-containing protein